MCPSAAPSTADLETPVSAFLRAAWPERECFLLESVEGGEQVGRYTFIGLQPFKRIVARGREIAITEGRKNVRRDGGRHLRRAARCTQRPQAGAPGRAAAVHRRRRRLSFAYDAVRQIERLPETAKDELGVPDACLLFFDEVLAFDHVRKEIWLVVTADVTRGKAARAGAEYDRAVEAARQAGKAPDPAACPSWLASKRKAGKLKVKHRTPKKDYLAAVERTKEYIRAGDIFQAVLSQRFDVEPGVDSFQVYRALRTVNPSPYMYFLRFAPEGPLGGTPDRPKNSSKKSKARRQPLSWQARRPNCWCACIRARSSTGPSPARARAAQPKPKTRRWPKR